MNIKLDDELVARIAATDIGKNLGVEDAVFDFIEQALIKVEASSDINRTVDTAMRKLREAPVGRTIAPLSLLPVDARSMNVVAALFRALRSPDQLLAVESKDPSSGYPVFTRI